MAKPAVLVVDDEPDLSELVVLTLSRMNIDTAVAGDLASARAHLAARHFHLCLTDMRLPDGDGLDLVSWIQDNRPQLPVAVITAHGNVELAVKALKLGAFDFVSKPLDIGGLRKMVASAVRLGGGNDATGTFVGGPLLIGSSARMQELRDLIGRVARSQAPVHIFGESGTGKELVARLIHNSGPRHDGPFVAVNCGAIPGELMESELFGHKRGSFTGAVADSPGLIRNAEGGTLFLDEVAELPLHMQVKLLRVIQEKSVRGVGEQREVPTDVRILSATHKKLAPQVTAGRFREDLYYRINVIEVPVPALREHREDMDELVITILRRQARKLGIPVPEVTSDALEALRVHPFPGNVRELENVLERALALHPEGVIGVSALQLRQLPQPDAPAPMRDAGGTTTTPTGNSGEALGAQLEQLEREAIMRALEATRYNKTAAAKLLGMSFRALRYKVKKLAIE